MMPLLLGLVSWLVMGLAVGLSGARLLPGVPPLGTGLAMVSGLAGALAGGLLATLLGFGGLAGYDFRSLLIATLAAVFALLLLRLAKLEG